MACEGCDVIYTVSARTDGRGRLVSVAWVDEDGRVESHDVAEIGLQAVALRLLQVLAASTSVVQVADGEEMRIGLALNAALSIGGYDHVGIRVTSADD
jgi:hypothetical protein